MAEEIFKNVLSRGHNVNTMARNSSMLSRFSFDPSSGTRRDESESESSTEEEQIIDKK